MSRSLASLRAWRARRFGKVIQAVENEPKISKHFDAGGQLNDYEGFMKHIADLMQLHIAEMQESMHDESDSQKAKQNFSKMKLLSMAWRKTNRAVGLTHVLAPGVNDLEGNNDSCDSAKQAAVHLRQYCSGVFESKRTV